MVVEADSHQEVDRACHLLSDTDDSLRPLPSRLRARRDVHKEIVSTMICRFTEVPVVVVFGRVQAPLSSVF